MSKVSVLIEAFESKIKMLEQSIAQAAGQITQWTNNHNGLTGMLQATKEALADTNKVLEVIAPASPVTEALDAVDTVAEALIPDEPASPVSASGSSDASSSDESTSS